MRVATHDPRRSLMRLAQQFFVDELVGVYSLDGAKVVDPIEVPREKGRGRDEGRYRALVALTFGPFELEIVAPGEQDVFGQVSPLGKVEVICGGVERMSGPLDAATWKRIGAFIRERAGEDHGRGRGGTSW